MKVPVQVIWGEQDRIVPSRHAKGLPGRDQGHVLDDAGHLAHMEKASEVNELIKAFSAADRACPAEPDRRGAPPQEIPQRLDLRRFRPSISQANRGAR